MNTSQEIAILLLGRLIIFMAQKAPYLKWFGKGKNRGFFLELFECDLCLGTWVYIALSLVFHHTWFNEIIYIPLLSHVFTGSAQAFAVWVFRNGWDALFKSYVIE